MRGEYRAAAAGAARVPLPNLRNLLLGLWERTAIFLGRVGTIILTLMVVLWFLASFPAPPAGATGPAIQYSIAGMLGRGARVRVRADRLQLADLASRWCPGLPRAKSR